MKVRIEPGDKYSLRVRRGSRIRITALKPGANVSMMLFNAHDISERFNVAETLKIQEIAYISRGDILTSDMCRVLASVTDEDTGWHDVLCGFTNAKMTAEKYGDSSFSKNGNAFCRNGLDNFVRELMLNGYSRRDLGACINLFSRVYTDQDGNLFFDPDHAKEGSYVELRAEMDLFVVISNTPHPLDPSPEFPSVPVMLEAGKAQTCPEDDPCLDRHPLSRRVFQLTQEYLEIL